MNDGQRILVIEDDRAIAGSLNRVLERNGYSVVVAGRGDEGLALAMSENFDVVLTDVRLPGIDGLSLVSRIHGAKPMLPILVMTAHGSTETAIKATKLGAYDYVLKPFEVAELIELIGKAASAGSQTDETGEVRPEAAVGGAIVGQSRAMQKVYKEIGRIATRPVSVLIRGETGTGKELVARAIHEHSGRSPQLFIAVNCAAIPEALLESELFGHERGAFTGAESRYIGRFEQAQGGTLFLDEIGELSAPMQGKLLRVLQERYLRRVGGREQIPLSVRVLAATNRDLEQDMQAGDFRDDLYYRLGVVEIHVPPLRERSEDIPSLALHFLHRYAPELQTRHLAISDDAMRFLKGQLWPGNVRELENVVRKAMLLARGFAVTLEHVREAVQKRDRSSPAGAQGLGSYIGDVLEAAERGEIEDAYRAILLTVERELYSQALSRAGGNLSKAARWLGVSRVTFREKLSSFGLRPLSDAGE